MAGLALAVCASPALASSSNERAAAKETLARAVPCDGTLTAFLSKKDSSYQMYRMVFGATLMSEKGLAETGKSYAPEEAARLVNLVIVTQLADIADIDEIEYEPDFQRGMALVKTSRDATAQPAVAECVRLVRELAPLFPRSDNAAKLFGLYPATPGNK